MHISCPGVISQSLPEFKYIIKGGIGHIFNARIPGCKPEVIINVPVPHVFAEG